MKPTSPNVVRSSRSRFRSLLIEHLESRRVLASDWRNPIDSLDVDGDRSISPLDPLVIINRINENREAGLPAVRPASEKFIDVDGDQTVSPLDVLVLINHINAVGPGVRTLTEQSSTAVTELPIVVTLGQSTGTRKLQFQITPHFDNSDQLSALGDTFAVYLVDPNSQSQTLLNGGESGSPFFQLSGTQATYTPGIVQWDGSLLTVDVSSIKNFDTGLLKLQLINADKDLQSRVAVQPMFNKTNASELSPSIANSTLAKAIPGVAVTSSNYTASANVQAAFDRVRYDRSANRLDSDVYLVNNGPAIGRDAIVVLDGLPASVVLQNKSGTTTAGLPYINFRDAIGSGGLGAQRTSARIPLVFLNPQGQPFSFSASVLAGPSNRAPTISPISPSTISPGGYVAIDIPATDLDSDSLTYSISAAGNGSLPTSKLNPDGTLILQPSPDELGTYSIDITVSDGMLQATRTVTINVVPDPITTTRTSGKILNIDGTPLVGVRVEAGNVQALTLADGSFLLDLGAGTPALETLRVRGELISGASKYPFIAEKLPFVLGHPIYNGYRNVIGRPIYLPTLNAGTTINPTQNTTVTQQLRPQESPARVDVSANTLQTQLGTPFTGQLSITEVPPSFTPVSLPPNIAPDSVVTIQPGEMTFSRPTPLSLPNRAGWAPGTIMDLWSINPITGEFDIVGTSRVSADGKSIDTITGGIRTSSWHMVSPPPPPENLVKGPSNDRNLELGCQSCEITKPLTSQVSLFTGGVTETHALVSYSSLGSDRSVVFMYDSLRADPRPIIHGGLFDAGPNTDVVMSVSVQRDGTLVKMPGFVPESDSPNRNFPELRGGEHFFQSPNQQGEAGYSLQLDLRDFPTGRYRYETATGLSQTWTQTTPNGDIDRISYSTRSDSDYLVHVNTINSPFGAGWGIAGLQQFFLNDDGSALLVDGDGTELLFPKSPTSNSEWLSPPGDFSKLVRRNDGTLLRTMKDQTRYEFDSQNRIATMTDRNGNQTQFQYSGTTGFLTSITDPVGLVTSFAYTNNKISSITDPAGRITRFSHDAVGNLTRVTDPDNSSRVWRYDDGHRMTGKQTSWEM